MKQLFTIKHYFVGLDRDEPKNSISRTLGWGVLVWASYSLLQLLVNGVVLDSAVVPAQIINRAVEYPPGHPTLLYYSQAYNLVYLLSAALWKLKPNPFFISVVSNILFVFLSTFVSFALATVLTGRGLWGYLAGALTAAGALINFKATHGLWVFPISHSQEHLGVHFALLIAALMLARSWRVAGLLLGLLPSIHAVMLAIAWPWSVGYLMITGRPRGRDRWQFLAALFLGLAVSLVIGIAAATKTTNADAQPPYNVEPNGELIYQNFSVTTDTHLSVGSPRTLPLVVAPVAFLVLGILLLVTGRRGKDGEEYSAASWILVWGGIAASFVYICLLTQFAAGSFRSVSPFVTWLEPLRFSNLYVLPLIPMTVAGIAGTLHSDRAKFRLPALIAVTGLVIIAALLVIASRVRAEQYLVFMAWGLLFGLSFWSAEQTPKRRLVILLGLGAIGCAWLLVTAPPLQGLSLVVGFIATFSICWLGRQLLSESELPWLRWNSWLKVVLSGAIAVMAVASLPGREAVPQSSQPVRGDKVSEFDRNLNRWLLAHTRLSEPILTALIPYAMLQVKTGHPVLMDIDTLYLLSRRPSLAPVIGSMVKDLYGVDYADSAELKRIQESEDGHISIYSPAWLEAWERRTATEWSALGMKYNFRLVLAPSKTQLDLEEALPGPVWTLYLIPNTSLISLEAKQK